MAVLAFYTIVIALKFLLVSSNPFIVASSPNLMRVGYEETVLVSLHNREEPVNVTVTLKLFENGDEGVISESVVAAGGDAVYAVLDVNPEAIPSVGSEEELQRYAYVTVTCLELRFHETKQVLLSYEEGFLFIQTDKPVYTPDQSVKIRVISLNQNLTPVSQKFQVDIVNPQDVIVKRDTFEQNELRNGIFSNTFKFYQDPMFGHWKIVAHYGKDMSLNRTVEFEVKEYVLPTFSVKIQAPAFILPTAENINIQVESRYVYDKAVKFLYHMKVGVQEEDDEPQIHHTRHTTVLDHGVAQININTDLLGEGWFEENVGNSLYIEVMVVEHPTGHFENAFDTSAKFVRSPYTFTWERTIRYFKKGLIYEVKTDLKLMNGKPAPGVHVKVIAAATIEGQQDETILRGARPNYDDDGEIEPREDVTLANDKGQVNFPLFVPLHCTNIRILLETADPELIGRGVNNSIYNNNERLEFNIGPFESPNGNEFLALRVTNQDIRPHHEVLNVDVYLNSVTGESEIHYFVISRGKLMAHGKQLVENFGGFSFPVSYEMVPSARIVAYYISGMEHIIADSVRIEIARECENPLRVTAVNMEGEAIGQVPISPQSQIQLEVTGTPGTVVALLAVDQAVLLLRDYHRLTPDKMYESMDERDTGCGPGGGRNSGDVFMNAGLMVLTNLNLVVPRREGPLCAISVENKRKKRSLESQRAEYANDPAKYYICKRGHRRLEEGTCTEKAQIFVIRAENQLIALLGGESDELNEEDRQELMGVYIACCERAEAEANLHRNENDLTDPTYITTTPSKVLIRKDFRESWAFDIVEIPNEAIKYESFSVPGSITTWSLQAFGLHQNKAMCVHNPVNLLVSADLFLQLHMPYSVIRKEFVEIQATVFNYAISDVIIQMILEVPDGICSEGTTPKEFIVPGYDELTITYRVVGLETGEFNIKVIALAPRLSDAVERKLRVLPEGVVKTIWHSTILNPAEARIDRGTQNQPEGDDLECNGIMMESNGIQMNCLDINLPPTAVPGSESCFVSVTGTVLGPILTSVISGLESLIRLPRDCGEQTMILLAPNVYVFRYLTITDSGTEADKARALSNVESGIARELTFRCPDGSYSAFKNRLGSTWLTAFVGKVFCQASEHTFVDTLASCGAIKWLMTVQRDDGAFVEGLAVIHRKMSGGVQGDAAMTAFALIAISECQCNGEVPALANSSARATRFLEEQLDTLQKPYVVAIVTYALALVNSGRKLDANHLLQSLASYDNATRNRFWGADASSLNPGSRPYWYQRRPSAISVETTGYALLAQLALGEITYSQSIVQWLSQQQNYGGGFVSTQDTVIALQALSEYATLNTNRNLDMYCNVTAPANFSTVLRLYEGDTLVQKTKQVPHESINGKLMIKTGGEGVGQLNVELKYNDLAGNNDAECAFILDVNSQRIDGNEGTPFVKDDKIKVEVCASYLGAEQTSMAILDVGLYSGFEPVWETLNFLVYNDSLINQTIMSRRSVIVYADHIPVEEDEPLCFDFEANCDIVVGNPYNAAVHVYDYYNPAEECTKFYAPPDTNLLGPLCSNDGMCACVSSKCAACSSPDGETEDDLLESACDSTQTYVYKIKVAAIVPRNGFDVVSATMKQVIKRPDDYDFDENLSYNFWVSSSCECPGMKIRRTYMVIGRNYLRYEDEDGSPGFKYIIDHNAIVRWWRKGRRFDYLQRVQERILNGDSNCG